MNIFKKVLAGTSAILLASSLFAGTAFAAGKAAPKTTGGVGYTAYGLQRNAEFNAIATSNTCSYVFDATGSYIINVEYLSVNYPETLVLTQSGTGITGVSLDTIPPASYFTVTGGSVIGNVINIDVSQGSLVVHMLGIIAPDGSMSGSWADEAPGTRTGTWVSTSGNATVALTGCTGKGVFNYSDVSGDWYYANVQYVNVDGTNADAYFAGQVTSASQPSWIGNWVQVAVHDGGEPAYLVDHIWGIFTDSSTAKYNVANKVKPDGDFVITSGNLQVH